MPRGHRPPRPTPRSRRPSASPPRRPACRRSGASRPGSRRWGVRTAPGPWRTPPSCRARGRPPRASRRTRPWPPGRARRRRPARHRATAPGGRRERATRRCGCGPWPVRTPGASAASAARAKTDGPVRRPRRRRPRRRPAGRRRPDRTARLSVHAPLPSRRAAHRVGRRDQATAPVASPAASCSIQAPRLSPRASPCGRLRRRPAAEASAPPPCDGPRKGTGARCRPSCFTQHGHLDQAQAETAVRLGALDGQPPLLGHGRPQVVVELATGRRPRGGPGTSGTGRRGGSSAASLQRPLVVRELEIHGPSLPTAPVGEPDGCVMLARSPWT